MPLGWPELIIVLVIVLLVLGPKRLPSLGRQLGGGMREFRDSISGRDRDERATDEDETDDAAAPPAQRASLPAPEGADAPPASGARDESATRTGG